MRSISVPAASAFVAFVAFLACGEPPARSIARPLAATLPCGAPLVSARGGISSALVVTNGTPAPVVLTWIRRSRKARADVRIDRTERHLRAADVRGPHVPAHDVRRSVPRCGGRRLVAERARVAMIRPPPIALPRGRRQTAAPLVHLHRSRADSRSQTSPSLSPKCRCWGRPQASRRQPRAARISHCETSDFGARLRCSVVTGGRSICLFATNAGSARRACTWRRCRLPNPSVAHRAPRAI